MDRPLRPLFPKGYRKDTQVIATVLSSDKTTPTDVLGLTGASAALHISDIPWAGPVVGVRVARVDGEFHAYPSFEQVAQSDIDLVCEGASSYLLMIDSMIESNPDSKDLLKIGAQSYSGSVAALQACDAPREPGSAPGRPRRHAGPHRPGRRR